MSGEGRVQRFRSVAEMDAAPVERSDDDSFDRFLRHCARIRALSPRVYPRGVFRYRSLEEAQRAREQFDAAEVSIHEGTKPHLGSGHDS
ncbi:MAG: hypothetical protein IT178_13645 [Acidobacteria bacterium]|nr:hypothetical protein [Acidobacteriota bacterium]